MINPNDFYGKEERLNQSGKNRIWNNIERRVFEKKEPFFSFLEFKSFSFGIGFTVILFFLSIGVYSSFKYINEQNRPETAKINDAYEQAIENFSKFIPAASKNELPGIDVDEKITVKKEELKSLDFAIMEFREESNGGDYSPIKQSRLRDLYKMKLKVLNELIDLEEK